MEKLKRREFAKRAKTWSGTVEYVQGLQDFHNGTYKVRATLYSHNGIGAREAQFYSEYKEKL